MQALKNLLSRQPLHCYALLDSQGICRALRQSHMRPAGSCWVAVNDYRLSWLQKPLPDYARL